MSTDGQNVTYMAASNVVAGPCVFIENNDFQFLGKLDFVLCRLTGLVEPPSVPKTV